MAITMRVAMLQFAKPPCTAMMQKVRIRKPATQHTYNTEEMPQELQFIVHIWVCTP